MNNQKNLPCSTSYNLKDDNNLLPVVCGHKKPILSYNHPWKRVACTPA